jgi:hypothetical protein
MFTGGLILLAMIGAFFAYLGALALAAMQAMSTGPNAGTWQVILLVLLTLGAAVIVYFGTR